MNTASQLSQFWLKRRPEPAMSDPYAGKTNLSDVLSFVSSATSAQLRAVSIAMSQNSHGLTFDVLFTNGAVETWMVDNYDQMINCMIIERREITKITKRKETIR